MKLKILSIILAVLMSCAALSACSNPAEPEGETPQKSESSEPAPKESTGSEAEDFQPDLEIVCSEIENSFAIDWISNLSDSYTEYTGFPDSSEISSDGLLNYFIFFCPAIYKEYHTIIDTDTGVDLVYSFEESDVQTFLVEHFEGCRFSSSEVTFENWLPQNGSTHFEFSGEQINARAYGLVRTCYIDSFEWNSTTNCLTVYGGFLDIADDSVKDGSSFSADFIVKEGKYLLRSLNFSESPKYLEYRNEKKLIAIINSLYDEALFVSNQFGCDFSDYVDSNSVPVFIEENGLCWYPATFLEWKNMAEFEEYLLGVFSESCTKDILNDLRYIKDIDGQLCFAPVSYVQAPYNYHTESIAITNITSEEIYFAMTTDWPSETKIFCSKVFCLVKNSANKWVFGKNFNPFYHI